MNIQKKPTENRNTPKEWQQPFLKWLGALVASLDSESNPEE